MKTVVDWFHLSPEVLTKGMVGIEIEVEGVNLPPPPTLWRREEDGSLRGEESGEYVFKNPLSLDLAKVALDNLSKAYKKHETVVDDTVRAGVHVHVNVQDLSIVELYNMMTVYLILENVLIKYCGEGREGNLFCLRAMDAPYILYMLKQAVRRREFRNLVDDDLRYSSMNVKALGQYGSLEFRAMRGTRDLDKIYTWACMLYNLRDFAKKFTDPKDILNGFSEGDGYIFLRDAVGDNIHLFDDWIDEIPQLLKSGVRCAQEVAYSVNWQAFNEPEYQLVGGLKFPIGVWFDEPQGDF